MSNPSYRPKGRKYDRRVGFWYYEGENCFTDAELTAMDAAVAAKDNAKRIAEGKELEALALYDEARAALDKARERIRELEEECAKANCAPLAHAIKRNATLSGKVKELEAAVKEARAAMKEEAAKIAGSSRSREDAERRIRALKEE